MAAFTSAGGARGTQVHNGNIRSTLTVAEAVQLKTGSGILGRVQVWNVGTTMTVDIYDHGSTTTNKIWEYVSADGKINHEVNIPFGIGLRVVVGGTPGGVNIIWQG